MKKHRGRHLITRTKRLYHSLFFEVRKFPERQKSKELILNRHIVRNCALNIMNMKDEWDYCTQNETGELLVLEEARDFFLLSGGTMSDDSISTFFYHLSERENLTYSDIACLIPALEFACLEQIVKIDKSNINSLIRSLRILNEYDCSDLTERLSKTENVLLKDDIYPYLDEDSKQFCRIKLKKLAQKLKLTERNTAVELLKEARRNDTEKEKQIGAILLKREKNRWYFPLLILLFLILFVFSFFLSKNLILWCLSLVPAFVSAKILCDTAFSRLITPEILPKIKITESNCPKSLVTVVSVLSDRSDAERLLQRLDTLSYRVPISKICIGLLLDFSTSNTELSESEQNILQYLEEEILRRNKKNNRYFCAVRKRVCNPETFQWEASGRKQGAMMDFCNLYNGDSSGFSLAVGNFENAVYFLPLDSDTQPVPGALESLIGFMEHPNHRPEVAEDKHGFSYVKQGYGAAAPRVEANPETCFSSPYSALIGANAGTELYKNPHFNLYQDLFGEGIFCGKGIIRLDLYDKLIANRFRNDPILSHDLPEGEILRCANCSDIVYFDDIPSSVIADEKRTHRWIRGDMQNTIFLFVKNNNSNLFRFKIIHNIARAFFPICCYLIAILSIILRGKGIWNSIFWLSFPLFLRLPALFFVLSERRRKYQPLSDFINGFIETILQILLLPTHAFNNGDALLRGFFRLIRNKKKLEWTTAASAAKTGSEISDYILSLRWQLTGFFLLFFPQTALLGGLWLIAPIVARHLSQPYRNDRIKTEKIKEDLGKMWLYFEDLMNETNHFLPPDNYQVQPLNITAKHTSPTNIGLAMLSVLGAYDLNFIGEDELYTRLENTLDTLESLPKWKGHLYNWYDVQTLKVLSPKFISTVDSGNLAASLYTLKNGLTVFLKPRADAIVERISLLLDGMNFALLYDRKKKLFPIGFHVEENKMSTSYYDLYASEARLTSYYAIMQHQIPVEHWIRLGRPNRNEGKRFLLSSWSGTAFEYFMPHLFLPVYRRTLSGEMLRGVFAAQIKFCKNIPWGISESGYYEFDRQLNYQYRAFGVPGTALRRDVSFPKVISPYSTFLAYPWFPSAAEKNAALLPKGKYGYYEAVDYRSGVDNPRIVQSFMAHHVGMSFLSGVNLLKNKIMQKRFMFVRGEAFSPLLTEKIPACSTYRFPEVTEKCESPFSGETVLAPDLEHPKLAFLTNGKITEIISDSGVGNLLSKTGDLTEYSPTPYNPLGIFTFIRNKGILYGTTYAPLYQTKKYRVYLEDSGFTCYGTFDSFETRFSSTLSPDVPLSVKELTVKNNGMTENDFDFYLFLSPVLCNRRDYEAHPEYKDLFLKAEYDAALPAISFCRREKGEDVWFSVFSSAPFLFEVSRDLFQTPSGTFESVPMHPIYPGLLLKGRLSIRGRGSCSVKFYLSQGSTKENSLEILKKNQSISFELLQRRYGQKFRSLTENLHFNGEDRRIFDYIAPLVLMSVSKSAKDVKAENTLPRKTLWKYGISGDYPMITLRIGGENSEQLYSFLRCLSLFLQAGILADLLILYREEEGYQMPVKTALDALRAEQEDGVKAHIFPLNIHGMEEYLFLQKCSSVFLNLERGWKIKTLPNTFRPILTEGTPVTLALKTPLGRGGYGKNYSYLLPKENRPFYRPCHLILANPRIGTVLSENGLGYTFGENASENRITPRNKLGNPSEEILYLQLRGKRYDLLKNASVEFQSSRAIYRLELFGTQIITEVFVPAYLPAKIIKITVENPASNSTICYCPTVILDKTNRQTVTRRQVDKTLFFTNAANENYHGTAVLFGHNASVTGNELSFFPTKEENTTYFVLGYTKGLHSAERLVSLLSDPKRIEKESKKTNALPYYVKAETSENDFNCFVNGFLQQQIENSRIFARTGPYQPGGAYGFRDQLQDAICLGSFRTSYLRRQILRCAAHQFEEGDVLHWWHPRRGQDDGLRTRFSDDPFWLAYGISVYYGFTGDKSFLEKPVPYLHGAPLKTSEADRYFTPEISETKESVYQHGIRALKFGLKKGQHGLILFGSGDWNDGMNGVDPKGETVWGTMFALMCLEGFQQIAESLGDVDFLHFLRAESQLLRVALEKSSFSDGRYVRGFHGDGTPFGGGDSIDAIPQAFAVFCGLNKENTAEALKKAYNTLWDKERNIIKLLSPPYAKKENGFPGTIVDYPPGVRENGGQYTHGGIWFARALLLAGEVEKGWEILSGINPVCHTKTPAEARRYGAEPYVMAADVYSLPEREGCAGWTHYTGAAGWYLKTITEDVFGFSRKNNTVTFVPHLPTNWNGCRFEIHSEGDVFCVQISRGTEKGIFEDGVSVSSIPLNGTRHKVHVIV